MDAYSWFRRSVSKLKKTSLPSSVSNNHFNSTKNNTSEQEDDEKLYGITDQLVEFVKSFSIDTFKEFPLHDEEGGHAAGSDAGNMRKDLSDWQERHAVLVLSKVKELSQLRFNLCPRYLKERQFWRIYFMLVRQYVIEYELRAVRLEKLRQMQMENGGVSNTGTCEVEMSETKIATLEEPATST